jgi:hypothetical protein
LVLSWRTNVGTDGTTDLWRGHVEQPSAYKPLPSANWHQFKEYFTGLEHYRYMYRGQHNTKRLRTPFHRTGRGDLRRFFSEDIQALHRHLSARTGHYYNLSDAVQNAAFLHLVQHHGYPTPLLDWTYSPFVAAFFAYYGVSRSDVAQAQKDQKVRVFIFDKIEWCKDFNAIWNTSTRTPHFSIVEPAAIGNERMVPQQALSSFTTVDDIEGYIHFREEQQQGKVYLRVIDLPLAERDHVMRELRIMGITSGSLFPGLDGACHELRDRFFGF